MMKTEKDKQLTVYISGPVTGRELEEVKERFGLYEQLLRTDGYIPVNPLDKVTNDAPTDGTNHKRHMKEDLRMLLSCDAILLMDDWLNSKGCRLEFKVAVECGLLLLDSSLSVYDTSIFSNFVI